MAKWKESTSPGMGAIWGWSEGLLMGRGRMSTCTTPGMGQFGRKFSTKVGNQLSMALKANYAFKPTAEQALRTGRGTSRRGGLTRR